EVIIQAGRAAVVNRAASLILCPAYYYSSRMIHMFGNLLHVAIAVFLGASSALAQGPSASNEAAEILVNLIKINTSNPPGNETQGAQYIKSLLEKEGIASEIFESAPGRGNIVARLKGRGNGRPLMLMAHLDVVGVERDRWTVDPFAGTVKDGYVYGRGASDDKGMLAANLAAFLQLHRE